MTSPFAGVAGSGNTSNYTTSLPQDRLVRREQALGFIREIVPPQDHIGLSLIAPFMDVASDDVIFNYTLGFTEGLAPARAEDAESELSQKDDILAGQGRASLIDWAVKDHYVASDVMRYRELLQVAAQIDAGSLPLTVNSARTDFAGKLARDAALRRRKLDNRLEWLIMQAIDTGKIVYNDGKIKYSVDFGRPSGQHRHNTTHAYIQANGSPDSAAASTDPITDIQNVLQFMYNTYGVRMDRALCSQYWLNSLWLSSKWQPLSGFAPSESVDMRYVLNGWGPQAAVELLQAQTGVTFIPYDSVYRTRPVGSTTVTANRFTDLTSVIFLPSESDVSLADDTGIGFAKTLTSPHPAGNWSPGYYEWEREFGVDPWGLDAGTGIKAFPVFPVMEYTYSLNVGPQ